MVAASRDAQKFLPADDADDAAGRSSPTCAEDSKTLKCVRKCKKRLKKCMLPWEKKKCGKTSTEECLARYVCCIDDYCCEPCVDPDVCTPDCPPGTDGCCCEGKICNAGGTCEDDPSSCVDPDVCTPDCPPGTDGCCCEGKICNAGGMCVCPDCLEPLCGDDGTCCTDGISETCNEGICVACVTGGQPDGVTCEVKKADPVMYPPCCYPNQCKDIGKPGSSKSKCGCDSCNPAPGDDCTFGYDYVCCPNGNICGNDDTCVPSGGPGCETAFARDDTGMSAGLNSPGYDEFCGTAFTRWGWTNGPYTATNAGSTVRLNMYAGAGQCDKDKGEFVGTAFVTVDALDVTITVTPEANYEFTEYHIQVSCDPLQYALKDGTTTETVAPGQYTVVENAEVPAVGVTKTFVDGSDGVTKIDPPGRTAPCTTGYWVIVHAVSCPGD